MQNILYGVKPLEEIIETAIYTGHLSSTVPVSVMLIGPSGAGKSRMILQFEGEMLHRSDDITSSGLQDILQKDEKDQAKTHIVLPDFNAPLSHKPSTTALLIANLLTIMSDGTARIDDGRETKTLVHNPMGIITGVTPEMFSRNEYKWGVLGFKRRFLPIFYDYSFPTIRKVQSLIRSQRITSARTVAKPVVFLGDKKKIALLSKEAMQIDHLSSGLAECLGRRAVVRKDETSGSTTRTYEDGKSLLPYSPHLLLQAMAKAHALRDRRGKVTQKDITFCEQLLEFCRYGAPKRL